MRRVSVVSWSAWFLAGMVCVAPAPLFAAEGTSASWVDLSLRKLGRGIANLATAPAELIRTSELVGRRDGYLGALTIGLLQGAWRTVLREVVGAFEVTTFCIEVPAGFGPLMKPEFVWQHGDWSE